jgi:hypothetical protein
LGEIEVIVEIGAEGGSITLFGQKEVGGDWRFCRCVDDQTPTFLSDGDGGGPPIEHSSDWVNSWSEAVELLDKYPWVMLSGQSVHPEFRERVWDEVLRRLEAQPESRRVRARQRWARVCGFGSTG